MSDDTPTQRFPSAGDDVREDLQEEKQKSKGLLIGLITAGALLLVAIIVLVFFLGRATGETGGTVAGGTPNPTPSGSASPEPTASDTPSATPTPEASDDGDDSAPPPPPPPSTDVKIDSFAVSNKTVLCNTQSPVPSNQYISFSWKTSNADSIVIGTYDPYGDYSGMYYNLPPDGNTNDLGLQITYGCPQPSQKWRLEVTGNGQTIKQEINIVNNGDTQ